MADQTVDRHIEECGQSKNPLGSVVGRLKLGAMIPSLPFDHLLVLPEPSQNAPHFRSCPVLIQGLQEADGFQRIIGFMKIK